MVGFTNYGGLSLVIYYRGEKNSGFAVICDLSFDRAPMLFSGLAENWFLVPKVGE